MGLLLDVGDDENPICWLGKLATNDFSTAAFNIFAKKNSTSNSASIVEFSFMQRSNAVQRSEKSFDAGLGICLAHVVLHLSLILCHEMLRSSTTS